MPYPGPTTRRVDLHNAPRASHAPGNETYRLALVFIGLLIATLALSVTNISLQLGGADLWRAIVSPDPADLRQWVLHLSTLPRMATAVACGATLALAGTLAQQVLRNPLAEPMTLGIFPGAYLALSIATLWAPAWLAVHREAIALAGGATAIGIVFALAWRQRLASLPVILAGMVVSLYCGSASLALAISNFQFLSGLMIWGGGALDQQGWQVSLVLGAHGALGAVAACLMIRPLSAFDAGEQTARGLGVSLTQTRIVALGIAVALTASVITAVGVIGFVGLAAPTVVRLAGARRFSQRLLWAPVMGAMLLWFTDEIVQCVSLSGVVGAQLIPTGAVTSLFGAPLLLWRVRKLKSLPDLNAADRGQADQVRARCPRQVVVILAGMTALAVVLSIGVARGLAGVHIASLAQIHALAFWHVPHLAAALSAGAMLGLAGSTIQRVTRNPIASPDLIGVSAGGGLGMIAAVLLLDAPGPVALFVSCLAGTLVTLLFLLWHGRRTAYAPERVLLIGVAMGALFQSVDGVVTSSGDDRVALLLNLSTGSTYYVQPLSSFIASIVAVLAVIVAPRLARWLELLSLGEDTSRSRGVQVGVARRAVLLFIALLSAASTMLVGPLSFVGLMAPHIARGLGIRRAADQLIASAAAGALLMVTADWIGRLVLFPNELPVGLTAALIGGPYLIWTLVRPDGVGAAR